MTFDEFVDQNADALLRYATAVTADPNTAKDVVQSVLERAFTRWDRISAMEHPDAYLRRMVVNEFHLVAPAHIACTADRSGTRADCARRSCRSARGPG